jgi:hypothetical protein
MTEHDDTSVPRSGDKRMTDARSNGVNSADRDDNTCTKVATIQSRFSGVMDLASDRELHYLDARSAPHSY